MGLKKVLGISIGTIIVGGAFFDACRTPSEEDVPEGKAGNAFVKDTGNNMGENAVDMGWGIVEGIVYGLDEKLNPEDYPSEPANE